MFSIYTDKRKNRLYIVLGAVDTGEGEEVVDEIKRQTAELERGFECISDISNFSFKDPSEAVWADTALKTLADTGMARAIRVTGTDVKYRETTEEYGYRVGLAKTVEDAEAILDQQPAG